MLSLLSLAVLGTSLFGGTYATPAPDRTRNLLAARSVPAQPGCPSAIGLTNGGFESGQISPWSKLGNTDSSINQHLVSPGYSNSKYALQVDAPASSLTEYSLAQSTTGQECYGYYYNISYSWNWVNYTGPEGPGSSTRGYCAFSVDTGYTDDNVPQHYGTRKAGWHHNSYIARDIYSHCKPAVASYVADVTCVGANSTDVLPAFSIRIDNFNIQNAPGSPNPAPTNGNGSC